MKRKRDLRNALMPLWAYAQLVLIAAAAFGVLLLLCMIVLHAGELGRLFIPALLAYFGVLTLLLAYILHRRQMHDFLAAVGPEIYFQTYPREKRRFERREARRRKRLERLEHKRGGKRT